MRPLLAITLLFLFNLSVSGQGTAADSARLSSLIKASRAYAADNDHAMAVKYLKQYRGIKDSILTAFTKSEMDRLEERYQIAKKDQKILKGQKNINLLMEQNRLTTQNLRQERYIRKVSIILAAIAGLLLGISYYQYRQKQKANGRLQKQQAIISEKNDKLQHLAAQKEDLLGEKELLIKEIHHRVKNNLQVVISLLNTQSAYLNDQHASAAIRQSQHRMRSISLIHQKLYQSESRALINMKEYMMELAQYLRDSFDTGRHIVFTYDIDDIELDVVRAVPIGLILNETITNALRHAFTDDSNGHIGISLNCLDGEQLKLSVTDDGKGLPPDLDFEQCRSLGIDLIRSMCRQLNGQLNILNGHGVQVGIQFPAVYGVIATGSNDDISSFDDDK